MIWIIVIGAGLLVFGAIYALKPSPRETRLAALRLDAIKLKLQVKQFTYKPDAAKTGIRDDIMATSYTLMDRKPVKGGELLWSVVAQSGWDTDELPEGFAWHSGESVKQPQQARARAEVIRAIQSELQDDLLVVEVYSNRVMIMVAEQPSATAAMYLAALERLLDSRSL
jgi:hypothetical protein